MFVNMNPELALVSGLSGTMQWHHGPSGVTVVVRPI